MFLALAAAAAEKPAFRVAPAPYSPSIIVEKRKEAQQLHDEALKLLADGKLEAARTGFQKVLNISPNNPAALLNLGIVEQRSRNFREAERVLRRAVQAAPENGAAWLLLGSVCMEQNNTEAAFAHFAQAVLHSPRNAQARSYLGAALARKGWYPAAEEELRRALELDGSMAEAHFNLALLYLQRVPPAIELARRHYMRARDLGAAESAEIEKALE